MIRATFRAMSPISHGSFGQSAGNASLFRRVPLVGLPGQPRVPAVSGNSLRGVMRRVVMREMFECAGLNRGTMAGAAWDRLYAALANGGHLDRSESTVDPQKIRDLRESLPPLSVFGAALYSWMLPGHMTVGWVWPRCVETVESGLVSPVECAPRAEDLVTEVSLCRHIEREHHNPDVSGVTPMPTTVEALAPGTVLESRIMFAKHSTPIERGVVEHALAQIHCLGGKSGSGLGRVEVSYEVEESHRTRYLEWLSECGDLEARLRGLAEQLASGGGKGGKSKKGSGK